MKGSLRLWMLITALLWISALALQARFEEFPAWPGFILFIVLLIEWSAVLVHRYKSRQK